jgi:hypothetical protein
MKDKLDILVKYFQNRFPNGFTRRETIGLSVILHLSLGVAIASMSFDKITGLPYADADEPIEFDLITDTELDFNSDQSNSENSLDGVDQNNDEAIPKLGEKQGLESSDSNVLVAENTNVNKEAVMMASLATLSELKESFNFVLHQVSADSIGAFTPLQGKAPHPQLYADGAEDGYNFGYKSGIRVSVGSGGGNCPGGGGGDILK